MRTPLITIFIFCVLIIGIGFAIYDYKKHGLGEQSIDFSKSNADTLKNTKAIAETKFYQGEYERAIEEYEKALKYTSRDAYLRNNLGTAYYRLGLQLLDTPKEEEEFDFGIEIDARNNSISDPLKKVKETLSTIGSNIVTVVLDDESQKKAIETYALSLRHFVHVEEEFNEDSKRSFWLTIVTGKTKEAFLNAEKQLRIAIDIKSVRDDMGRKYSGYSAASRNLGTLLFRMGRKKEALAQWQRALQLEPTDAELRELLGRYE